MSILSWENWKANEKRLRGSDIRSLLKGTQLNQNGILLLADEWGGSERYEVALAMYGKLPEYREKQQVLDLRWFPLSHLPISDFTALESTFPIAIHGYRKKQNIPKHFCISHL